MVMLALAALAVLPRALCVERSAPPLQQQQQQPTVTLSNGVHMPRVLLGMGLWCNTPACPPPAKPCHDCYNDSSAAVDIALALANGFRGIDTALG